MNHDIPLVWRALYEDLNGRAHKPEYPQTRDPDAPCDAWEQTDAPDGSGHCLTDGHYMCVECIHISLATLRRRRDQCDECGAKLSFENSRDGDCPNECDVPEHILKSRFEYAQLEASG